MKYDRLTERTCLGTLCYDAENISILLNRLAELEDKIEQGTLKEIPCKVGDTVYCFWTINGKKIVVDFQVVTVVQNNVDWFVFYEKMGARFSGVVRKARFTDFGKRVFLTREEAEAKLKELQNG